MMNEVAATSEETTAYTIGHTIGTLLNLKRMVELNMEHDTTNYFSKDEIMDKFDRAINKLNKITYPYKV